MINDIELESFNQIKPRLLGLAYRILGSLADAEDAVQDTFVKWQNTDRKLIENTPAWLTTVCTRRCLDLLRAAYRARVDYVGMWLPEPIQTLVESDVDDKLDLDSSLTIAFLLMLERLTPKERAAYLLHDIFDISYSEVAETLDIRENTCRKLVSRAKANIDQAKIRNKAPLEKQEQLLAAFQVAITEGETEQLATLLSQDIQLSADGGGKVPAILEVLRGKSSVMRFLSEDLNKYWAGLQWTTIYINDDRGFVLRRDGIPAAIVSFAYDKTGDVSDIYIVRNPEKIENFGLVILQ